jgi:hypothetical protein
VARQRRNTEPLDTMDEEREPAGIFPVERKVGVAKAPVVAEPEVHELAEVVGVELQQVREDGLLFQRCRHELDGHG